LSFVVLATANFQEIDHAYLMFEYMKHVSQPGLPLMAMEFWTGWFDRWSEKHHLVDNARTYFLHAITRFSDVRCNLIGCVLIKMKQ
jgi:Glycosyl hydrolases family 35